MSKNGLIKFTRETGERWIALAESLEKPDEWPYWAPVGTEDERISAVLTGRWPGSWVNVNPIGNYYRAGRRMAYHTGADLNLNRPVFDSDAHAPVYSIGAGRVEFVRKLSGWGSVVVLRHDHLLSRYGHLENIKAVEGGYVERGAQIGNVGNAGGNYPYHLHFDVAPLHARMGKVPGDWPGLARERVRTDYYDPEQWLKGRLEFWDGQ